jgi:hypothetical protein
VPGFFIDPSSSQSSVPAEGPGMWRLKLDAVVPAQAGIHNR